MARIDLSITTAGSSMRKQRLSTRPITNEAYLRFVDSLMVSDLIKERLRKLVFTVPAGALRNIVENIHEYLDRCEQDIKKEDDQYYEAEPISPSENQDQSSV